MYHPPPSDMAARCVATPHARPRLPTTQPPTLYLTVGARLRMRSAPPTKRVLTAEAWTTCRWVRQRTSTSEVGSTYADWSKRLLRMFRCTSCCFVQREAGGVHLTTLRDERASIRRVVHLLRQRTRQRLSPNSYRLIPRSLASQITPRLFAGWPRGE